MPIKTSQILQDDGALDRILKQMRELLAIQKELLGDTRKEAAKLRKEMKNLSGGVKQHQDAIQENAKEAERLERAYKKYNESMSDTAIEIEKVRQLTRKQNQMNRTQAKLALAAADSYDALSAQYAINKKRIKEMTPEQLKAAEATEQLVTKTEELYDRMNELQKQTGKYVLQVGKYTEAAKGFNGVLGKAASGVEGFNAVLSKVAKNPFIAIIAVVVGGLTAIFKGFQRTEKGAALFARAAGIAEGALSFFVGVVDNLVKGVEEFFKLSAKERWQAIGDAIKENLTNRFEAFFDIFSNVEKAIGALVRGDWALLRETVKDTGESVLQFTTGVEDLPDKLADATKEIIEHADAFGDLRARQRAIIQQNAALAKSLEDVTTAYELNAAAAGDTTLSFKQQQEAADAAREALEKKARIEVQIARNNLSLIQDEISLRQKSGENVNTLLEQEVAAFQGLKQAQREYTLAVRQNNQERRNITLDEFERELDFAIDFADAEKTIRERQIVDQRKSLEERRKILEETRGLIETSFQSQIELAEEVTGVQLNLDQLARESDERIVRQRLRSQGINDRVLGRILEILRERKLALQDLDDAEATLEENQKTRAAAARARIAKQKAEQQQAEFETFEQTQQLKESEFALVERTEEEKTKFRLEAERAKLQKLLELNEKYSGELTSIQLDTIRNQVDLIDQELSKLGQRGTSIYDMLSLKLSNEEREGIKSSINFLTDAFGDFTNARIEQSQKVVNETKNSVQEAVNAYEKELQAERDGLANKKETARLELQAAKQAQEEAIKEQQKAQRRQAVLDAVSQASNLLTASTKIWKQLGFPFAIPAVAFMWGQFLANKIQAFKLTKSPRKKGGFEFFDYGDSHESGNDIPLGMTKDGDLRTVEKGESMGILSRPATRKYKHQFKDVVNSMLNNTFERRYTKLTDAGIKPRVNVQHSPGINTSKIEEHLAAIRKKGDTVVIQRGQKTIVKKGNITKIYGS
jgi:hypothetical protein